MFYTVYAFQKSHIISFYKKPTVCASYIKRKKKHTLLLEFQIHEIFVVFGSDDV